MRLFRGILFAGLAASLLMVSGGSAKADYRIVDADSGSLGVFTLTRTSIAGSGVGSVSTMQLTLDAATTEHLDSVTWSNGVPGTEVFSPSPLASFTSPMVFSLTNLGSGLYSVSSSSFDKTFFGAGGIDAHLQYNITSSVASGNNFLNLSGSITSIVSALMSNGGNTYDFSTMLGGFNGITLVGTSFGGGATSFNDVILNGGSVSGSGSFAEISAVPEPSSMALLAIGAATAFALSRRRKVNASV